MAKWVHSDVLDNGISYIKNNCDKVAVIVAYTAGDSFATVAAPANIVGEAAMASGDFTIGSSGQNRTLTTAAGKSDTAANNNGDPTHFAYLDTVNSKVLWVTTENSIQDVTAGNPVSFPSLVYTSNQPT
jgi:hypothetical protein